MIIKHTFGIMVLMLSTTEGLKPTPAPEDMPGNPAFGTPPPGRLHMGYFNYEHGGIGREAGENIGQYFESAVYGYDYDGLVRVVGQDDAWPDILVMGEGDRYEYDGMNGAWGAAEAMKQAGSPPYTPLLGRLANNSGSCGPVVFVDFQKVTPQRWYGGEEPGANERNRNLLVGYPSECPKSRFYLMADHGNIHGGAGRLRDVERYRRLADAARRAILVADWNGVQSGPQWEPQDLNNGNINDKEYMVAGRALWEDGYKDIGTRVPDTRSLDYLLGEWRPNGPDGEPDEWGHRVNGMGFYDVAELKRNATPTQYRKPRKDGREHTQSLAYCKFLVNAALKECVSDYWVREPVEDHPSDHLMVDVIFDMSRPL
jgi:hypothetical protein